MIGVVRRVLAAIVCVATLAVGGVGCGEGFDRGDDGQGLAAKVIRFVTPFQVKSLDPIQQGLWAPEWGYGELLMRATEMGTVEPWLLQSLDREAATRWRLTLRPDVTFANGDPLDAATLKVVFDRHVKDNPAVAAKLPGTKVDVIDDRSLRLTTSAAMANLPNLLADEQLISVFDPKAVDEADGKPEDLLDKGIYTGPFDVTELDADHMVLKRNDDYWGGDVALEGAEVRFVPDGQARVLAVRSGEADVALYPPTESLRPLRSGRSWPRAEVAAQPLQQLRAFLNLRKAPMNDVAVRRAFAATLDCEQIAKQVLDGIYTTPTGLFPDAVPYAEPTQHTDLAAAGRLLDRAGWRPGKDGIRQKGKTKLAIRVLTYPQQPDTGTIAVAMQAQLKQAGFDVHIDEVPNNYDAMAKPTTWDVGLSFDGTLGYTYDPIAPLRDFLTSKGAHNFGGVADPALDQAVARLQATGDDGTRNDLLAAVQQRIAANVYTVIVAQRASPAVVGEGFAGYRPSSVLHHLDANTKAG
ncbi:periplasmic substrate-binding domain-containing protein [Flindersiella endophytica]